MIYTDNSNRFQGIFHKKNIPCIGVSSDRALLSQEMFNSYSYNKNIKCHYSMHTGRNYWLGEHIIDEIPVLLAQCILRNNITLATTWRYKLILWCHETLLRNKISNIHLAAYIRCFDDPTDIRGENTIQEACSHVGIWVARENDTLCDSRCPLLLIHEYMV